MISQVGPPMLLSALALSGMQFSTVVPQVSLWKKLSGTVGVDILSPGCFSVMQLQPTAFLLPLPSVGDGRRAGVDRPVDEHGCHDGVVGGERSVQQFGQCRCQGHACFHPSWAGIRIRVQLQERPCAPSSRSGGEGDGEAHQHWRPQEEG